MLKKTFFYSLTFLVLLISLIIINLLIINKKDYEEFKKVTALNSSEIKSKNAYQERKNVKKDLYIVDSLERKHFIITSKSSEIYLDKMPKKYNVKEKLSDIEFHLLDSDKLLSAVKYLQAKDGVYYFPEHEMVLNDVNIFFFQNVSKKIDSQNLDVNDAFFKGKSSKITFSIFDKKPKMISEDFKGKFSPPKSVICEK
ncbi:MAG: hypothetical protein JXA94_00650 [Parachlamydiales bacterium]|nr:hypothetical protein [Parachlamydiales bacterium]